MLEYTKILCLLGGKMRNDLELILGVIFIVIALAFNLIGISVSTPDKATIALESQGYTNVQVTHKAWFFVGLRGCSAEDVVRYDVVATNPADIEVDNVYVCLGWPFKGATVRSR